ncbi:synergin gamma-like [Rhinophrynus dorsalis]
MQTVKAEDDDFQDFQDASKSGEDDYSFSHFQKDILRKADNSQNSKSVPPWLISTTGTAEAFALTDKYAVFKEISMEKPFESLTKSEDTDSFDDLKESMENYDFSVKKKIIHEIKKQSDLLPSPNGNVYSSTLDVQKKESSFYSTENSTVTNVSNITKCSNDYNLQSANFQCLARTKTAEELNDHFYLDDMSVDFGPNPEGQKNPSTCIAAGAKNVDFGEFQSEKSKISKFDFLLATSQGKVKSSEEMIKNELATLDLCSQGSHKRSLSLGDKELNKSSHSPAPEQLFQDCSNKKSERTILPVIRDKYKYLTGEMEEGERYSYEWQRCLQSALQVIGKANDTLNGISSSSVCTEVIQSAQGMEYLLGIVEVYRVTKRIELGITSTTVCSENLQLILKEIDKLWNNLIGFMSLAALMPDESALDFSSCMLQPGIENAQELACGVCLLNVSSSSKEFNSESDHFKLSFGGHQYHATCANFWINCVEPKPPGLFLPDLL